MRPYTFLQILLLAGVFGSCAGRPSDSVKSSIDSTRTRISDDSLLTLVEYKTFRYFWDGAEPVSGMARERYHSDNIYPENDKNIVTSGGSGFGLMALVVGMERGFITRSEGIQRLEKVISFLEKADKFHGALPHWLNGETGKVKPFGMKDDGADLVETAYLMQGLITVKQYLHTDIPAEKLLANRIDSLWKGVEWNWFTRNGEKVLYWHWSPNYGWEMNFPVKGYNECLILYIMAASSPSFSPSAAVYHQGWARNGEIRSSAEKYGHKLILKHNFAEEYGGPLFWSHYSYLGLDPRNLFDEYANYWDLCRNHALINYQWCVENPKKYKGYGSDCWGLTASYSIHGYSAHAPGMNADLGVITPTAALSSFPFTPEQSMKALNYFYYNLGDKIWGEFGFYDAFSEQFNFYPKRYLAIDQGPIVSMIENYRTGLLWKLFMSSPDVQNGLKKLGFSIKK
jgi:hypothetical protein